MLHIDRLSAYENVSPGKHNVRYLTYLAAGAIRRQRGVAR
jgi:hypothetical protein